MKTTTAFIILFLSYYGLSFSQTKDTITLAYISVQNYDVNPSTIKKIVDPKIQDYEGSYHFGDSEGESQLEIIYSNAKIFARTDYADWENNTWAAKSDRLAIKYLKGKILIDKINYELSFSDETKGLTSHYYENTDENTKHFIQFNPNGKIEKPKGKYPEASFVKLTADDLSRFSKYDLKIMRNEIFARKGYVFKHGGEIDSYFSQKEWYKSIEKINNISLNAIEKHNLELIQELEKTLK